MSRLRADKLVNRAGTGAPQLTYGAELPVGYGLTGAGGINITGIISTGQFVGDLTGTATTATALQNSRTFEITGDIVASAISFDGTGNVSLAATIQPNSVALGSDTTGDYVSNITGTSNQITVTSGTGEGSTPTLSIPNQLTAPQDVTVTRDLQVNRDLNVNGNITIGGTSATLFTTELKIFDPDIVLGFRTDVNDNDVSNDNTANHGGVAIASTEGDPLVELFIAGIETNPATYKKIMWFKSGTFAGLGTDAWLSNYAVGIGSTQFPIGTRLASGAVQFTESDLAVVQNINASGVVTATSFVGDGSNLTGIDATALKDSGGSVIVQANSSGIVVTGVVTATSFSGDGSGLTGAGSTVADDTTTNETFYPLFTQSTSGTVSATKVSTTKFTFNPSTGEASATNFNSTSDENLKTNIHPIENSLNIISNIRGVSFDWKENGKGSYGVIAQELEQVLPELVTQTDPKSVNYNGIIGILIEGMKSQQNQINELKAEVELLKNK